MKTMKTIFILIAIALISNGCKQSNSKSVNKSAVDFSQMTFAEVKTAADEGNPQAQNEIGNRFYFGIGISKDSAEAVKWWQKSATQKFPPAELDLGLAYLKGDGVSKDEQEGIRLLRLGVDAGLPRAKEAMGMFYFLGAFGLPKDYTQAFNWFKAAAQDNYPPAQYYLAECFRDGKGTQTNLVEAIIWFEQAASNNMPNAEVILGNYYFSKGFSELGITNHLTQSQLANANFAMGAEWLRKAANQNYLPAQMFLVFAYRDGAGVPKDSVEAYKWFVLSSMKYPSETWKTNGVGFTAEEISAGRLQAEEFSKTNHLKPKSVDQILGL